MRSSIQPFSPSFIKPALLLASPEMARRIASHDWSSTPLGPIEQWSSALRNTVEGMLATGSALLLWWGPSFIQIYNDAYRPVLGDKHPKALGQPVSECWDEIVDTIGPLIETPFSGGAPSVLDDLDLTLQRHGYAEEAHFTVAYSAVFDDAALTGIGGVMATVYGTTERIIADRRMRLLSALAVRCVEASDPHGVCDIAANVLATDPQDIPYAAFYLFEEGGRTARLAAIAGAQRIGQSTWPEAVDVNDAEFPVARMRESDRAVVDGGHREVLLPIRAAGSTPWGFIVAGTSRRLPIDDAYLSFLELIAPPVSTALDKLHAYAAERERAEALAELDRAKNVFFSNVSHEFRTPLTLILGPLAELAKRSNGEDRPLLTSAHRNALRLLKLVNTLLEFSRVESGHSDAIFVETDLANLTSDLCSAFRSAIEGAGLAFNVDVAVQENVFVDRAMWEKIVFNLLSNALKFTVSGEIRVTLQRNDGFAELVVRDTGVGIEKNEQHKIFERFHRLRPSEARTYEGTGIGLALVGELVHLHGGAVSVESDPGEGSAFRVRVPFGSGHLPANLVRSARNDDREDVAEQYLADLEATVGVAEIAPKPTAGARFRILLVDDNRDLREYIAHIVGGRYDLAVAKDGLEALAHLKGEHFDLVLTDVMMPRMDGAGLVAAMRDDPELAAVPIIMLSARAGEESSIEMLRAGAVDYVVKPFNGEQLLARIDAQLDAIRRHGDLSQELLLKHWFETREGPNAPAAFRAFANELPVIVWQRDATGAVTFTNAEWHRVLRLPYHSSSHKAEAWRDVLHPDDYDYALGKIALAIETHSSYESEYRLKPADGDDASYRWYLTRAVAQFDHDGIFKGWIGSTMDVHEGHLREDVERRLASAAQKGEREFRELAETIPVMLWIADSTGARKWYNARWYEFTGQSHAEAANWGWQTLHPPPDLQRIMHWLPKCVESGEPFEIKASIRRHDGQYRQMLIRAVPVRNEDGEIDRWFGCATDIQYQQEALERTKHVADVLKNILLPTEFPSDGGLQIDGIYQSPNEEELIGGDWFDAMRLPDGRLFVSIGDVTGHGVEASVLAARLRHAAIDYSLDNADPSAVLQSVNRVIYAHYPGRFATALVGFVDPRASLLTYACAGHYPPMMAHEGAPAQSLPHGGLPLGVEESVFSMTHRIAIPSNAVLAFYTDGIVEFENDIPLAEERLKVAVSSLVDNAHAARPAKVVRDAVMMGAPSRDDAALLILRFAPRAAASVDERDRVMSWRFHSSDAQTVGRSRAVVMRFIEQFSNCEDELFDAELVIGEALANTFRHAPGIVEVEVDCSGPHPVLIFSDSGPGIGRIPRHLPSDVLEERGRGLFIAQTLAASVVSETVRGGGTRLRIMLKVTLSSHQPAASPSLPKSEPAAYAPLPSTTIA